MTAVNWQVQKLDGSSVSDHGTEAEAQTEAMRLTLEHQVGHRVRRTA